MADRIDLPRIKPQEAPSMINVEAGKMGMLFGALGSIAGTIVGLGRGNRYTGLLISNVSLVAGTIVGGLNGKAKQEKEQIEGRVVKQPGYWNAGILGGLTAAAIAEIPLKFANVKKFVWIAAPLEVAAMVAGSSMRKNSLQRDFDQAVAMRDQEQSNMKAALLAMVPAQTANQVSYKNSVNAEESELLAQKQQSAPAHHANKLETAAPEMAAQRT